MTTAVTPNSPFKGKNTAENTAKTCFLMCLPFFDVFVPFLRSWRPGNASKGFLEVVRWISTEYEPVASHQTPKSSIFDVFDPTFFRPTNIFRRNRSHMPPQAKPLGGNWPQMDSLVMSFSSKSLILMHIYNVPCHFSWKSTFSFRAFPGHFKKDFVSLLGF